MAVCGLCRTPAPRPPTSRAAFATSALAAPQTLGVEPLRSPIDSCPRARAHPNARDRSTSSPSWRSQQTVAAVPARPDGPKLGFVVLERQIAAGPIVDGRKLEISPLTQTAGNVPSTTSLDQQRQRRNGQHRLQDGWDSTAVDIAFIVDQYIGVGPGAMAGVFTSPLSPSPYNPSPPSPRYTRPIPEASSRMAKFVVRYGSMRGTCRRNGRPGLKLRTATLARR